MKYSKIVLLISLCVLLMSSCKHENFTDKVGPDVCEPDGFSVSNYTVTPEVDFTGSKNTETVKIYANLSHSVNWTVTIKGKTTKAVKSFSNKSNLININWDGLSDSLTFFSEEDCDVNIKFTCFQAPTKNIKIKKKTNFKNIGALITDFDGNGGFGSKTLSWDPGSFAVYPNDVDAAIGVLHGPGVVSPQGGNYFSIKTSTPLDEYYASGSQTYKATLGGYKKPTAPVLDGLIEDTSSFTILKKFGSSVTTDQLYLNFLCNISDNKQTALNLSITVYKPIANTNSFSEVGYYSTSVFPKISKNWEYISVKLSDFKKDGLPIPNPTKIGTLIIDYGSRDKGPQKVDAALDLLILTKDQPLFPKLVNP